MNFTRDNALWFAGLYEGEGSLWRLKPNRNSWTMAVKMTDQDVIEKINVMFPGHLADYANGLRQDGAPKKHVYEWRLSRVDKIYALVAATYPFVGARRRSKFDEFLDNFSNPHPRRKETQPRKQHTKPRVSAALKSQFSAGLIKNDPVTGQFVRNYPKDIPS